MLKGKKCSEKPKCYHFVRVEISTEPPPSTNITSKTLLATLHLNHQSTETYISESNHHRSSYYQVITQNNYLIKDQIIVIKTNIKSQKVKC